MTDQPFCFICSRSTEHVGDHDDLLEAGLVKYRDNGSVVATPAWDGEEAERVINETRKAVGLELR